MLDINGQELREGDLAKLLCEVVSVEEKGIAVRILNSDMTLFVDFNKDEALGGDVASSELTRFVEMPQSTQKAEKDAEISRSAGSGAAFE